MAWVLILIEVFRYGLAIFNIASEIKELLEKLRAKGRKDEAKFAEATFSNALDQYKKHKDRRLLLALRDRLRKDCYGENCDVPA